MSVPYSDRDGSEQQHSFGVVLSPEEEIDHLKRKVVLLQAEVKRLRESHAITAEALSRVTATMTRVEALADEWIRLGAFRSYQNTITAQRGRDLRAVLLRESEAND